MRNSPFGGLPCSPASDSAPADLVELDSNQEANSNAVTGIANVNQSSSRFVESMVEVFMQVILIDSKADS